MILGLPRGIPSCVFPLSSFLLDHSTSFIFGPIFSNHIFVKANFGGFPLLGSMYERWQSSSLISSLVRYRSGPFRFHDPHHGYPQVHNATGFWPIVVYRLDTRPGYKLSILSWSHSRFSSFQHSHHGRNNSGSGGKTHARGYPNGICDWSRCWASSN